MLRLRIRQFSELLPYPFHQRIVEDTRLEKLPFILDSDVPEWFRENTKDLFTFKPDFLEGFRTIFSMLTECYSEKKWDDLDGLVEYNLLNRLKQSSVELDSHDLRTEIVGSVDDTKVIDMGSHRYSGGVTPFRNLQGDKEFYNLMSFNLLKGKFKTANHVAYQNPESANSIPRSFTEFEKLNLEALNKTDNGFNEDIDRLLWILGLSSFNM
jgi:hypothetical protein